MSKVLFLANHYITLYSYRKELISRLCRKKYEVYLSLPPSEENQFFKDMGCFIIDTEIDRRGVNPVRDLKLISNYRKIITQVKPDIIFSYTIKPNIYGAMISNRYGYKQVCNITGTGATFLKKNVLSNIATFLYRHTVKNCYKVFFQNTGDRDYFILHHMIKDNWEMLPGSGCNLDEHPYINMPEDRVTQFVFIGRIMELKGIDEYLICAKEIKTKHPNTRFLIAGWIEEGKYENIISDYEKNGYVEYIGFRKDIGDWIAKSHCTILPAHGGEGVPNVLLETAATGRACIGSKISGTTSVIDDGVTGYLFEPGNVSDLAAKIEQFCELNFEQKKEMGIHGRQKVEREFDRNIVVDAYMRELEAK